MNTGRQLLLILAILFLTEEGFSATSETAATEYPYVINLVISTKSVTFTQATQIKLRPYLLYSTRQQTGDRILHKLRLGFFKTREEALQVYNSVQHDYLNVSIETVDSIDQPWLQQWLDTHTPAEVPEQFYKSLLQLGNDAMQKRDYTGAIGLYTRIIESAPNVYQAAAQENLGLARERNNQPAHALAEYRIYLQNWPEGEGARRVKARLDQLINQQIKIEVKPDNSATTTDSRWIHYGQLYQFYYQDKLEQENSTISTERDFITTSLNYTARTTGPGAPMLANLAFTHVYDIENSDNNKERLTSLYFDMSSDSRVFDMRAGRQKNKRTSLFGRYDGIDLGYGLNTEYKARFTYGYPVEFYDTVESATDKSFYALGLELFPEKNAWHSSVFYLEQQVDDILDRQELVFDTKYLVKDSGFFCSLDYSLQYETMNLFLASFNRQYADKTRLNLIADYRKTPFLTTTNALQGQTGVSSLSDLLATLTQEEIEQLSLDRTATYKSFMAYYEMPLTRDVKLTADATLSNTTGTVASAGVPAVADTGNEYSYALGLVHQNLFLPQDQNLIQLRYSNLAQTDVMLLSLSSLLRLDLNWRLNPRFQIDRRDYNDGRQSTALRPAFRLQNRLNKYWQLEMELAYENKETEIPGSTDDTETRTLLYAGYILSF